MLRRVFVLYHCTLVGAHEAQTHRTSVTYSCLYSIVQSVYRWATGWTAGVRFPVGTRNVTPFHNDGTCSVVHPDSYPTAAGDSFLQRVKRPERKAGHSPPCSAGVENGAVCPLLHVFFFFTTRLLFLGMWLGHRKAGNWETLMRFYQTTRHLKKAVFVVTVVRTSSLALLDLPQ
jgi:hypothetical protein